MIGHVALGVGAGLVAALLFAAVGTGSIPAVALMYLAPLPILIVALGWHHLLGALALAVGAFATSLLVRSSTGIAFAVAPGLAGWGLAYLTLIARPAAGPDGAAVAVHWYPTGKLLMWVGIAGGLIALCALAAATGVDHDRYREILTQAASGLMRREARINRPGTAGQTLGLANAEVIRILIAIAPALLGAMLSLILAVNLWLAGRIVAISGRLVRPWPDIPSTRMPMAAALLLGAGAILSAAPGFVGVAGSALLGGLAMAFALQGLTLMHDVSRHRAGRGLLLSLAYFMTIVLGYVFLPAFALLGLADTAFPLRRALRAQPPA